MKPKLDSTRRRFLWNAGATLSAALAMIATSEAQAAEDTIALKARLAALEDLSAIRALQREYANRVNAGAREDLAKLFSHPEQQRLVNVCAVTLNLLEDDAIEIGPDNTATARVHCVLETAQPIESCPLVEMARAQGGGMAKRCEQGILRSWYVKQNGAWKIKDLEFRAV